MPFLINKKNRTKNKQENLFCFFIVRYFELAKEN